MDTTAIALLGKQLTDFLVKQFAPPPGSKTWLGFLGTGVAVDPNSFISDGQFNPARVNQWLDIMVDPLGEIDVSTNQVAFTPWTATQLLEAIYSQAMCAAPVGSDSQLGFAKAKSQAMEGLGGATTVNTAPLDWYDPARLSGWPTCSLTASSTSAIGTGQPPPTGQLWAWRDLHTVPLQAIPSAPPAQTSKATLSTINTVQARRIAFAAAPMAMASPAANVHFGLMTQAAVLAPAHTLQVSQIATQSRLSIAQVPASLIGAPSVTPSQALMLSQAVSTAANQATTTSVASNSLSLNLKYQVVSLSRALWWNEFFMQLDNWYVPNCGRASMIEDSDTQKVFGVPIALILTDDVNIRSAWSSADRSAATTSTHFGPWVLSSSQFQSTSTVGEAILAIPGVQAIACIYRQLPALPPKPDPNLTTK